MIVVSDPSITETELDIYISTHNNMLLFIAIRSLNIGASSDSFGQSPGGGTLRT